MTSMIEKLIQEKCQWTFHIGIHRGNLTSRDAETPKIKNSLDECRLEAEKALKMYTEFGCRIWFCYAIGPDKQRVELLPSSPYDYE